MFATRLTSTIMVGKSKRYRIGNKPRDAVEREWEIFIRDNTADSLRHAGSISAPTADVAHIQTTKLFGWYATDIWVCPATAVRRYSTHTFDEQADPVGSDRDSEKRSHEA